MTTGQHKSTWWQRFQAAAGLIMQVWGVPPAVPFLYAATLFMAAAAAAQAPTVPLTEAAAPAAPGGGTPKVALKTPPVLGSEHLLLIVPFDEDERLAEAMENWFRACATDEPFALELVGTRREQGFVLRANSETQLVLLRKQFEAQYPQADIYRINADADPLALHPGERALVGEFPLAQASWMQIKTFSGEALDKPGGDPLAHILSAMEAVGPGQRIVAQLTLQRAPDSWIAPDIRKAVEHPLQEERDMASFKQRASVVTTDAAERRRLALLLAAGIVAYFGYHWYQEKALWKIGLFACALLVLGIGLFVWRLRRKRPPIYDMKLVAEKLMRQAFYCQLRVIVIGRPPQLSEDEQQRRAAIAPKERERRERADCEQLEQQLRAHLLRLEVAYRQFSLASANSFYLGRTRWVNAGERQANVLVSPRHAFPYHRPLSNFLHGGPTKCVLTSLELTGPYHLLQALTDTPLVKRTSIKHLLFSPEVARRIEREPAPMRPVPIGYSRHRGHSVRVFVPFFTLYSNKFLIGRSRSGKSVLAQLLSWGALQSVCDGSPQPGFFGIDPHCDLVNDLLYLVPPERLADLLLLDFTDAQFPVALNPLDATMGMTRDQAVSNLMSAFERIWHDYWGPRMSYLLNGVCLLLFTLNEKLVQAGRADEQYTLLDINPLLQNKDYATRVLSQLDMSETWHQELLAWWQETVWTLPPTSSFRNEVIMPILSKMGVFKHNQLLRRIVGQPVTNAPVHEAVTKGRIVLAALSSRDMDDASVNILGSTLCNLLHASFRTQQEIPLTRRRRVFVCVDEFQNFSGSAFDKLLSEDAKFGCAMLMATQNLKRLNQVKEGLLEVVMSNCQNLFAFNMSAADAKLLEDEFQGKVLLKDFITQPRLHCYTRLEVEEAPLQLASILLARPASWDASAKQQGTVADLRERQRQARKRAMEVDEQYKKHLGRFLRVDFAADKVKRDAGRLPGNGQRQAAANGSSARAQGGPAPSSSAPAAPSSVQVMAQQSGNGQSGGSRAGTVNGGQQSSGGNGQSGGSQAGAANGGQQGNGKRNNPRSRRLQRLKKNPVGTPPPALPEEPLLQAGDSLRPLSFPGGWAGGGFEGRERERS